ncbi:hypothetical protein C0J52_14649 [Blattella germanica]|nr:hypothetical protein C0J52_14649 [Blattella germanica]
MEFCRSLAVVTPLFILCFVTSTQGKVYVRNVKTTNCGDNNDPIHLEEAQIRDSNEGIFTKLRVNVKENINAPIKVHYKLEKKTFFRGFVPVPFQGGEGTITDVCSMGVPGGQECPEKLRELNLPCRCPVQKAKITIEKTFPIPKEIELMKGLLVGDYRAQLRSWHLERRLACYDITFSVS